MDNLVLISKEHKGANMDEVTIMLHNERAAVYALLARLYEREVDADLWSSLALLTSSDGDEEADRGLGRLMAYVNDTHHDALTELAVDYTRLFVVRSEHGRDAAYPFESVYTSKEALLMDTARDEVLRLYRQVGLAKTSEWKQGEDHISLELEYMSVLAQRTAQALEVKDESLAQELLLKQVAFLKEHLLTWVTPFTVAMEEIAKTEFYKGLALLTRGYLEQDCCCLLEENNI